MSRIYDMSVEISGHDPEKASQIQAAAERQWPFSDWWLAGEEDESEPECRHPQNIPFPAENPRRSSPSDLSVAIWRANGGFCEVIVTATSLETCPTKSTRWTSRIMKD